MDTRTKNKPSKVTRFFQFSLAAVGAAAFDLYRAPAIACTQLDSCGKWLYKQTPDGAHWIFWIAGGGDYGAMNIYFAFRCIPGIADALRSKTSMLGKVATGIFIPLFVLPKLLSNYFLIANTPGANLTDKILAVGGAAPGNMYAGTRLAEDDLPRIFSVIHNSRLFNFCRTQDEIDFINHFQRQQAIFNQRLDKNWLCILEKVKQTSFPISNFDMGALEFLFSQGQMSDTPSSTRYCRGIFQLLGWSSTAATLLTPIIINVFNGLKTFLPNEITWRIALTVVVGAADIYLITKFIIGASGALFDALTNLLQGKPIDSLTLSLYPKLVPLLGAISLATASLSYSLVGVVYDKNMNMLPPHLKADLKWFPIVGINIYHLIGLMHFCDLVLEACARNPHHRYLFNIQNEMLTYRHMTLEKFTDFVKRNPAKALQCGITMLPEALPTALTTVVEHTPLLNRTESPISSASSAVGEDKPSEIRAETPSPTRQPSRPQRRTSWCSLFNFGRSKQEIINPLRESPRHK